MRILAIGDVVGVPGCEYLRKKLPSLKKLHGVDFCIVNGENSAAGNGITPQSADYLLDSGVDMITTGNHVYRRREIYERLDTDRNIIFQRKKLLPVAEGQLGLRQSDAVFHHTYWWIIKGPIVLSVGVSA